MPGKIKLRIISARNLPIMDRSSDSSDAFVEVRFGANIYDKTPVCKKSLDPEWNCRFVFEVEEDEIQEEPLQIRVLDHDTYSSHDAIGKVYIDLKPLLNPNGPTSIHGWYPIYDTMHGIRGEINIQAKVEIFNDCNEYRKSSCGVQFFCSSLILNYFAKSCYQKMILCSKVPDGYILQNICGFVEELVINDDPEYQWIDKIRTPRTSNETRQKLFSKLSGEVQRRIGLKVLEMEANSVLGYLQNFDLEGEHGIVVRGIGTAANIYKSCNSPLPPHQITAPLFSSGSGNTTNQPTKLTMHTALNSANMNNQSSIANKTNFSTNKESEYNSIIVNAMANLAVNVNTTIASGSTVAGTASSTITSPTALLHLNKLSPNRSLNRNHSDSDLKIYQQQYFNTNLIQGNLVHQTSLINQPASQTQNDLVSRQQSILDKLEYPFLTIQQYPHGFIKSLCGMVCARSVKLLTSLNTDELVDVRDKWWTEIRKEIYSHMKSLNCHVVLGYTETQSICEDVCVLSASGTAAICDETFFLNTNFITNNINNNSETILDNLNMNCKICHVAYSEADLPFPVALSTCGVCGQGQVPDVLFTSIQPIPEIETIGQGCLLRAIVTRPRKKCSGEISAKIISDYLPFMEYELHRQLLGKLKLKGMNLLYGLKVQISIGENLLIALSEATACFSSALPSPMIPKIMSEKVSMSKKEMEEVEQLKKLITEEMNKNKDFYNLKLGISNQQILNSNNDDVANDSKALFKIELDDIRDKESVYLLLDSDKTHKKGFYACSTEYMPGISKFNANIQMFTSVYRCETSLTQMNTKKFNEIADEIMSSLHYKFRKYTNCCLSNLSFDNSLYDDDHLMIIVTGCFLTFSDLKNMSSTNSGENNHVETCLDNHQVVEITNLSFVPNAVVESYLGHLNLFLIRESTQIKENGGLSGFMHCFISEVLALTRAHVKSLGGNALVSFKMNECVLLDNPHRNQGQCLINIAGDALKVTKKL